MPGGKSPSSLKAGNGTGKPRKSIAHSALECLYFLIIAIAVFRYLCALLLVTAISDCIRGLLGCGLTLLRTASRPTAAFHVHSKPPPGGDAVARIVSPYSSEQ